LIDAEEKFGPSVPDGLPRSDHRSSVP
jgi:hypothetical protein